ncbi:MAG: hypothetical protein V1839_03955, partial [archaeon]
MAKISKETLMKFVESGFFESWVTLDDVLNHLAGKGFTIKKSKTGLVAQLLTYLCQDNILEKK